MTTIRLDTTELDRIAAQLGVKREAVGRKVAFDIEARAKQLAPVDTSALRNSIYTVTQAEDGYSQAAAAAESARPGTRSEAHPKPSGNVIACVGPCVEYAEYVELGTSKMAAQPYLVPAVEQVTEAFNSGKTWEALVK